MSAPVRHAYVISLERWPLAIARPAHSTLDESAVLDAMYRELEAVLARKSRFVALLDLRGGASNSRRRRRLVAWTKQHDTAIRAQMVAMAVVVGSQLERGFVTAAFWLTDNPYGVRVFSEQDEAEHWLLSEYERRHDVSP